MNRLHSLRKQRGITQQQLGYELNISQQSVSRIEKIGEWDIPSDLLIKLADYYNISIDYLVGKEEYIHNFPRKSQEITDLYNRLNAYNRETLTIMAKRLLDAQNHHYKKGGRQTGSNGEEVRSVQEGTLAE